MRRRDRAHAGHPSTYVANWPAVADTLRGSPFAALVADANVFDAEPCIGGHSPEGHSQRRQAGVTGSSVSRSASGEGSGGEGVRGAESLVWVG